MKNDDDDDDEDDDANIFTNYNRKVVQNTTQLIKN